MDLLSILCEMARVCQVGCTVSISLDAGSTDVRFQWQYKDADNVKRVLTKDVTFLELTRMKCKLDFAAEQRMLHTELHAKLKGETE